VNQLTPAAREALRLRLEGMRPSHIARRLGLTTEEAKQLLAHAYLTIGRTAT
jgi:DNA-binding CsgD family transcriptional regulator